MTFYKKGTTNAKPNPHGCGCYYSSKNLFSPTSYIMPDASVILQTVLVCAAMLIP